MVRAPASEDAADDGLRLDALAYKMMGSLLVLAGALLLTAVAGVLQFEPVLRDGVQAYAVPGTGGRHTLDATATSVVAWSGGVLSVLGLVGLMLGRAKLRHPVRSRLPPRAQRTPKPLWRSVLILAAGLVVLAVALYTRKP